MHFTPSLPYYDFSRFAVPGPIRPCSQLNDDHSHLTTQFNSLCTIYLADPFDFAHFDTALPLRVSDLSILFVTSW
jgi:hypothetical protein